jgi:hypothetical protein
MFTNIQYNQIQRWQKPVGFVAVIEFGNEYDPKNRLET